MELDFKIIKPVDSASVRKESETGGSPPGHASAKVPPGPVVVDGLSGFVQAVTTQTAKIHGMESAEKRCGTGVIGPLSTISVAYQAGAESCDVCWQDPQS